MKNFKAIGVLGGMGHVATAHFYNMLLSLAQKKYSSVQDYEYPQVIINSLAMEGMSEDGANEDTSVMLSSLIKGIQALERAGAEVVVMPCNTAHIVIGELQKIANVPIISIIDTVVERVKSDNVDRVGLLATNTTQNASLYARALMENDITLLPCETKVMDATTGLIYDIMGGKIDTDNRKLVLAYIEEMKKGNVDAIILGCTELPIAITQNDTSIKLYNSSEILAEKVLDFARIK